MRQARTLAPGDEIDSDFDIENSDEDLGDSGDDDHADVHADIHADIHADVHAKLKGAGKIFFLSNSPTTDVCS